MLCRRGGHGCTVLMPQDHGTSLTSLFQRSPYNYSARARTLSWVTAQVHYFGKTAGWTGLGSRISPRRSMLRCHRGSASACRCVRLFRRAHGLWILTQILTWMSCDSTRTSGIGWPSLNCSPTHQTDSLGLVRAMELSLLDRLMRPSS